MDQSEKIQKNIPWPNSKNTKVKTYKYLGIKFDENFEVPEHLKDIKRKVNFLTSRLRLCVKSVDPELRRILWNAIIRPYFEYIAPTLPYQRKTIKTSIINQYKLSFKNVICLPKSTKNELLSHYLGDLEVYGHWKTINIMSKWRHIYTTFDQAITQEMEIEQAPLTKPLNTLPKEFIDLCRKLNFIKCSCDNKSIITLKHLYSHHQVRVNLDEEVNFWLDETKHTTHAKIQEKLEKLTATLNLVNSLSGGPPL